MPVEVTFRTTAVMPFDGSPPSPDIWIFSVSPGARAVKDELLDGIVLQ